MKNINLNIKNQDLPNTVISKKKFQEAHTNSHFQKGVLPHTDILNQLLHEIKPINFREEVYGHSEKDAKLQKKHYIITCIENLSMVADQKSWSFCQKNGLIYMYNGEFWKQLNEEELKQFLGLVAERMGIDKYDAKHYHFKDNLLKQFYSSQYLKDAPKPKDKVLINLKNGTFEFTKQGGRLRPFSKEDFLTYQLPFEYTPTAKAPQFDKYLNEVLPSEGLQKILSEYMAYIFCKHIKLEKVLLLYGDGANGKSVFFDIATALIGKENTSNYSLQSLTDESGYTRAKLADKLVNYASEINGKMGVFMFKILVSGEPVEARLPYKDPMIVTDYARLFFNTNELPKDIEHTTAFYRRFLIIPFEVTIPKEKQDKDLSKRIIDKELSGVFNWVLRGVERLIAQKKFSSCDEMEEALKRFEKESDSVQLFLEDHKYEKTADEYELVSLQNLYMEYGTFCLNDGYKKLNKKHFKKRLERLKIQFKRKSQGVYVYLRHAQ